MKPLLKISKLHYNYIKEVKTLVDINFSLNRKEILGILGPNGGGKSTLLKLITGILELQAGVIEKESPQMSLSYIPQKDTTESQIPMTIKDFLSLSRLPKSLCLDKEIQDSLERVGLTKNYYSDISLLSGGEYQRVLLAKAWLANVDLIIMDEPTKGLDGQGQDKLLELIIDLKEEKNSGIILVDHNIGQVIKNCDRILCLNKTIHWHDNKELINRGILEATYQCEFEHLLIHEQGGDILHHHHHHESTPCHLDHNKKDKK